MSTFSVGSWIKLIRILLLKLIHFAYSVFEYLDLGWLLIKRKYAEVLELEVFDSQLFVSEFVMKLEKRPSHFVVIVGDDGINVPDFSNLVVWCLAAKISFVSFYDYSGHLKANEHIYYKYLIEKKKVDPNCLIFDIEKLNAKNGILHKIHLNILSLEDGKPLLVELSKRLSQNVISNKLKLAEINERLISNELYKFSGLPEPDLVVVSGNTFGTFGFLPWHIRVTEFLCCHLTFHPAAAAAAAVGWFLTGSSGVVDLTLETNRGFLDWKCFAVFCHSCGENNFNKFDICTFFMYTF